MTDKPPDPRLLISVIQAENRIRPFIRETPLCPSPLLSGEIGGDVVLKPENWQVTGSFKVRGAANRLLSISEADKSRGAVTASSGNNGAAFAHLTGCLGIPGIIFLPETVAKAKYEALRRTGADIRKFGDDCVKAETRAHEFAEETGRIFVSPYNDPLVVAGQGTIGLELARQAPHLDVVLVPVGGGGLISGIAGYLKALDDRIRIIGCQPVNSPVMAESVRAGRILEIESLATLSDGTAGGIEPGSITFNFCRDLVDEFILVSESEIARALRLMIDNHHMLVEGAAALPVAALLRSPESFSGLKVALVISGSRIGSQTLVEILRQEAFS